MASTTRDLLVALDGLRDKGRTPPPAFRQAVITAVTGSTVTIQIGGSTTSIPGVKFLNSYSPSVGDTVWVMTQGSDVWVVGELGAHSVNADLLDGLDSLAFRRIGIAALASTIETTRIAYINGSFGDPYNSLNRHLSSGEYNCAGLTTAQGAPPGWNDGRWFFVHHYGHIGGTQYARQVATGNMTGPTGPAMFARICPGGDPTVLANWTAWEPIGSQPWCYGYMQRASNYTGATNARFQMVMTEGTADDGHRPLYWNGASILFARRAGWYEFTAHNHTSSSQVGIHSTELRRLPGGGTVGEVSLAQHYQGGGSYGGSISLATGPVLLAAGDGVDLVQLSPDGVSHVYRGLGPVIRGKYLGPNA